MYNKWAVSSFAIPCLTVSIPGYSSKATEAISGTNKMLKVLKYGMLLGKAGNQGCCRETAVRKLWLCLVSVLIEYKVFSFSVNKIKSV